MAVIRSESTLATQHEALVDRLVDELRRDTQAGQPFVYINDVGQTGTLHVTVVWDAWEATARQQRAQIIMDAMERHDPRTIGHITIAIGLTGDEARRLGLLPYKIQLLLTKSDESKRPNLEQLLRDEGAFKTREGLQLLFRSAEQANRAYDRLQSEAPGRHWALLHEESNSD